MMRKARNLTEESALLTDTMRFSVPVANGTCSSRLDERRKELLARFSQLYKRQRYLPHKDRNLDDIMQWLMEPGHIRGEQKMMSEITGVPESTLSTWKHNLTVYGSEWRPSREHYGEHLRAFTDEQELELMARIEQDYLSQGLFYSDQDFAYDARRFYIECWEKACAAVVGTGVPFIVRDFKASPSFILQFRQRHKRALRRPNLKRRPTVTPEQILAFRERVNAAIASYGQNRVFNMDETNYRLVNNGHLTWAYKGQKTVNCAISNDVREGITVLATISAAGDKLPLMILGKGTTERCLERFQLGTCGERIWSSYSSSG